MLQILDIAALVAPESLQTIGYLAAAILFILALAGLSRQETARAGNVAGIAGMALAVVVTLFSRGDLSYALTAGCIVAGGAVGALAAAKVRMTAMPEMVAILNGFGGLGTVFVGFSSYLTEAEYASSAAMNIHLVEVYVGVAIGALTFVGSMVAWGKLAGRWTSAPVLLPARHLLNLVLLAGLIAAAVPVMGAAPGEAVVFLGVNAAISALLGLHLVAAIGGADMPVVVSLLNSYSGWAAAAAGFMLGNDLLIITGALVGSSGAILSHIMAEGMNRSLVNVVFGGFGTSDQKTPGDRGSGSSRGAEAGEARATDADEVAQLLERAERVAIVPGYGMAVARAQHAVSQLTRKLRRAGKEVTFGIHPVAGRMPGHMNVLLAEAEVPYDLVLEMSQINPTFADTDVVLVVGANDIVNPSATDDPTSPIWGMPQMQVWKADTVVVLKRSLSPGYAGVANPLFFRENTRMFFGDAREQLEALGERL
ncbi:NAD(P)(+) transhydrogenase (Re/Si-specific) subunit beta [Persicimonas caeni]|uniref:NAD(P) transhydrogenase subunit beta n=1 Tax=Persicimonas caeni TaxID=2292766 RepID=A0A4Y6PLN0_PERCE|nr:NAD(P)(+) transhydrogenase (Re/Si-specific) subunit beta [Persicimonas caeni]QDG49188.1 NAD(P)(+) transhydrogenase (Re/Si-specific) subunit beta [Persicimonas caeni]QED30409.1 NAD(P)(+) transhydrogenase (Re/Si-specific) subunit beta [Persicimonas caeni]